MVRATSNLQGTLKSTSRVSKPPQSFRCSLTYRGQAPLEEATSASKLLFDASSECALAAAGVGQRGRSVGVTNMYQQLRRKIRRLTSVYDQGRFDKGLRRVATQSTLTVIERRAFSCSPNRVLQSEPAAI